MNKEINKIRKLLGNRYHLCTSIGEDFEVNEWHLFRRYDDTKVYFSKDNEKIMSSETNTLEDLMKFAKKHHKIDEHVAINNTVLIVLWIAFIVCLINPFVWNSGYIRAIVLTIDFFGILITFVSHIVWNKNWKVEMCELDENYKENMKRLMKEFNEKVDKYIDKSKGGNRK